MKQITISNGKTSVTMPITRKVVDDGKTEYKEKTMASGKKVRDIIGFRKGFTYEWDYIPSETINSLMSLLRTAEALTVSYFDVDGTEGSALFYVSYPNLGVFAFRNDVPIWHDCKLTISAVEVD